MNEELRQAVLNAITELAETELLELVAEAAVTAVVEAGWFPAAGWEYAVREGDRVLETGFNTPGQADAWARREGKVGYTIRGRRVGVWENVPDFT